MTTTKAPPDSDLAAAHEPFAAAAMRGQYELPLAGAERAVTRLFPAARAHVIVRTGGAWHEWSRLENDSGAPGIDMPAGIEVLRRFFALALQTCERQRIAVQNLDDVQALQRVATRMLESHELSEILLLITQEAKRLLGRHLLHKADRIVMRRCVGNRSPETATLEMRPGHGLAGLVLAGADLSLYVHRMLLGRDGEAG